MKLQFKFGLPLVLATALLLQPGAALAYVGPGAGLTAIGTLLGLLAVVALAIVGFVWYPVKRMMRKRKAGEAAPVEAAVEAAVEEEPTQR